MRTRSGRHTRAAACAILLLALLCAFLFPNTGFAENAEESTTAASETSTVPATEPSTAPETTTEPPTEPPTEPHPAGGRQALPLKAGIKALRGQFESGKTGFFAKVLNAIRNFFLKIGNLFQKLFGFV